MSLNTYEVKWKDKAGRIKYTRVYPGTPESVSQFVMNHEIDCVEILGVRREINMPTYKTCGYCRHTREEYTVRYEDCLV